MQLLLLRHADAVFAASTDAARPLSGQGVRQAHQVARFCKECGFRPDLILCSPFLRTEQTARIVAEALDAELLLTPFLASGVTPSEAMEELRAYARFGSLLIVGHEPDLSELAGALLGTVNPHALQMGKATLAGLEVELFTAGGAQLEFLVPAKLMQEKK